MLYLVLEYLKKIHSDQGKQFVSKLFVEMCNLLQIEKTRTTPYHPESDGMVERFNRTLCAMLSAYVDENHRNWDDKLQFVMMAYRSTDHETTGVSPNRMMLGREISTPLDLIYEMPSVIKPVPANQWVWELQENMENVHKFVRQYTGRSINRQKKYHDIKLYYEKLNINDKVYVYFPVKKIGNSSKFTSFWKGPFQVKEKLSDVLYKVDCGRAGSIQVIHVDRLRKVREQVLTGENFTDISGFPTEETTDTDEDTVDAVVDDDSDNTDIDYSSRGRERRKPAWYKDYVLSIFRSDMSKKMIDKPPVICPICNEELGDEKQFEKHVLMCARKRQFCDICKISFKKKEYLARHMKLKHETNSKESQCTKPVKSSKPRENTKSDVESSDEEWMTEPDVEILETDQPSSKTEDIELGRVYRKRTCPEPVVAPVKDKRKKENESETVKDVQNKLHDVNRKVVYKEPGKDNKLKTSDSSSNSLNSDTESDNSKQMDGHDKKDFQLEFNVSKVNSDRMRRSIDVSCDGESLVSSSTIFPGKFEMGKMEFTVSDFVGKECIVKPNDINIVIQDGCLKVCIKYDD